MTYADCVHTYNYNEELGCFATVPAADPAKQQYNPDEGGGASWFHADAFCWAALYRADEAQREKEIIRCMRHYLRVTHNMCPDGKPVYHNNKVFTYTVANGHSILHAIKQFPELFEAAKKQSDLR